MAVYILVKEAPTKLEKGEAVISGPNFLEQIKANTNKAPRKKITAVNHLRQVVTDILMKYDPDGAISTTPIPFGDYEGLAFDTDFDLHDVVMKIVRRHLPALFDKYVDFHIKNRPFGVKTIFFTGSHLNSGPFTRNGINKVELKDLKKDNAANE